MAKVAFCIKNSAGVVTTDADGSNLSDVANTQNMIYPAWTPDGAYLAVMNEQTSSEYVSPRTTVIDTAGVPKTPIVANNTVWAGMPSVNPTNQNQFVFAGQWIGSQTSYDQNKNYVWFADLSTSPITLRPLDQKANSSGPFNSAFQGRAPWWSPDGNWVAFESNRLDPNGEFYGIYIQDFRRRTSRDAGDRYQLQRKSCEVVSKWNAARSDAIADAVSDAVQREKGNLQSGREGVRQPTILTEAVRYEIAP